MLQNTLENVSEFQTICTTAQQTGHAVAVFHIHLRPTRCTRCWYSLQWTHMMWNELQSNASFVTPTMILVTMIQLRTTMMMDTTSITRLILSMQMLPKPSLVWSPMNLFIQRKANNYGHLSQMMIVSAFLNGIHQQPLLPLLTVEVKVDVDVELSSGNGINCVHITSNLLTTFQTQPQRAWTHLSPTMGRNLTSLIMYATNLMLILRLSMPMLLSNVPMWIRRGTNIGNPLKVKPFHLVTFDIWWLIRRKLTLMALSILSRRLMPHPTLVTLPLARFSIPMSSDISSLMATYHVSTSWHSDKMGALINHGANRGIAWSDCYWRNASFHQCRRYQKPCYGKVPNCYSRWKYQFKQGTHYSYHESICPVQ